MFKNTYKQYRTLIPMGGKVSRGKPLCASSFYLEAISRMQNRQGEPKQSWAILRTCRDSDWRLEDLRWLEFAGQNTRKEIAMQITPKIFLSVHVCFLLHYKLPETLWLKTLCSYYLTASVGKKPSNSLTRLPASWCHQATIQVSVC